MEEKSVHYFNNGYNCSQCILKAAEDIFNIAVPKQCLDMCNGVSTGFGINSICSVLMAGIMVFGLLFDEVCVKRLRIKLLDAFKLEQGEISCQNLRKKHSTGLKCDQVVYDAAKLIHKIINEECIPH